MATTIPQRPCVLVFAGHDPSGGAGIQADIEAIAAQGAHALPVITALTVQDNDHAYAVHAVDAQIILQQAMTLMAKIPVSAIKIGIVAHRKNAATLASFIQQCRHKYPGLPVVLDPVLGSGHGDALALDDAVASIQPLLAVATLITPNLPEARRLFPAAPGIAEQATALLQHACQDVLIKGGHGDGAMVRNSWFHRDQMQVAGEWEWPRLTGEFHGSGCTLASAIAGQLAHGKTLTEALRQAQIYTQAALSDAYAIADGQRIPQRQIQAVKGVR